MKTFIHKGLRAAVSLGALMAIGGIKDSETAVQDELNGKFPPPVVLHGPHPVVMIPGTNVYMVPDITQAFYFVRETGIAPVMATGFGPNPITDPGRI